MSFLYSTKKCTIFLALFTFAGSYRLLTFVNTCMSRNLRAAPFGRPPKRNGISVTSIYDSPNTATWSRDALIDSAMFCFHAGLTNNCATMSANVEMISCRISQFSSDSSELTDQVKLWRNEHYRVKSLVLKCSLKNCSEHNHSLRGILPDEVNSCVVNHCYFLSLLPTNEWWNHFENFATNTSTKEIVWQIPV